MARSRRSFIAVLIVLTFIFTSLILYSNLQSPETETETSVDDLKLEIADLSSILKQNRDEIAEVKKSLDRKGLHSRKFGGNKVDVVEKALRNSRASKRDKLACSMRQNYSRTDADIQMVDVYKTLSFDNPDGGVWKQGWDITYDQTTVTKERQLQVIVVPHSHCDPGWIKTFEQYYEEQTRNILDGMAKHLGDKENMKFIYAEISFFERWWRDQTQETREMVKKYLKSGQLEIVTGGWVMTDEANSHYFSIITELFEGHEWLKNTLDYRPTSHWSIDPFGLSPSVPLLLSAANITNAVLQRVHYSVKMHLAKNKQLEFMWRQMWGSHGQKDVRTHVFPFYSYDIPHTCGPEPAVCCQFDFNRLPGGGRSCDWNIPPEPITRSNVAERALMLYDQYRKKSQLYKTNVLLVPLGDDFRYDGDFEWSVQYSNYRMLFEKMNSEKLWNVKALFGTLADYFNALGDELTTLEEKLPVLTGDFFTYADRDDHYWSGYFTSRPFYKQMDRVLQHYLRSAEITFTMASMRGFMDDEVFSRLVSARRALSLFQHHDGVTGTAKDHVVEDYGQKMLSALGDCEKVLSTSLLSMLGVRDAELFMHEKRTGQDVLPQRNVFQPGQTVVVFNPLSRSRREPICITVSSVKTRVDKEIPQQISPILILNNGALIEAEDQYELCFQFPVKPFAAETFVLKETSSVSIERTALVSNSAISSRDFSVSVQDTDIVVDNGLTRAVFDVDSGFLKTVSSAKSENVEVNLKFVKYGARGHNSMKNGGGDDLSGAYLFLPDGEATPLPIEGHHVVVVDGSLVKRVYVAAHKDVHLLQKYSLFKDQYDVEIETEVDIRAKSNFELAMRFDSAVKSGDDIFTDLNGMQMIRRVRMLGKLPLQAHFYPMPDSAYIEDGRFRLNLLGAQALGVASLKEGQMEVMLDRRLEQDDGRGLFQGVLDNKRTLSHFRLLLEPLSGPIDVSEARVGFLSSLAHSSSLELHYPWIRMGIDQPLPSVQSIQGLSSPLPCDVHVVTLRTSARPTDYGSSPPVFASSNEAALILHRTLPDCRSQLNLVNDCTTVPNSGILPGARSAHAGSLTLLYEDAKNLSNFIIEPQEIRTVKLTW